MTPSASRDPSKRRRRIILIGAFFLLTSTSAAFDALGRHGEAWRPVDLVRITGIMALAFVLAIRSTTNLRLTRRNPALDDELTRANRASAALAGFWAMMITTLLAFLAAIYDLVTLSEVAPPLLSFGAVAAAMRFAYLEARGERGE